MVWSRAAAWWSGASRPTAPGGGGRRRFLAVLGGALLLALPRRALAAPRPTEPAADALPTSADDERLRALVQRLASLPAAVEYASDGRPRAVFGLPFEQARTVLFPSSRERPLPAEYVPPDLVTDLGKPLRAAILPDLRALLEVAAAEGIDLAIISGYRSYEYQVNVFERAVSSQLRRSGSDDRAAAEQIVARSIAPPGHSQHQLGTTLDVSTAELGYALRETLAETAAGRWLAQHAHEYGFITPYTTAAEARTGYVAEPWHLRWVGRPLAAVLWEMGYLQSSAPTADDMLLAIEQLMSLADGREAASSLTARGGAGRLLEVRRWR